MGVATLVEPEKEVEPAVRLNPASIGKIKKLEAEAEQLKGQASQIQGEADQKRAQAAGLIVKELDRGATERQVAQAIGKSNEHVHFAQLAFRILHDDKVEVADFQTAYRLAKKPAAEREAIMSGQEPPAPAETAESETSFRPWNRNLKNLRELLDEMLEQANYKQALALDKLLVRYTRAVVEKHEEMARTPGQVPAEADADAARAETRADAARAA